MRSLSPNDEAVMVDPDGDLILQVGQKQDKNDEPSASGKVKCLRVSSKILTITSPVFKAMLCGPFLEGQLALSNVNPPVLPLPEDDPEAMELLTNVLHYQNITPREDLSLQLCELAVTGDKYHCNIAIRPFFRHQLLQMSAASPHLTPEQLAHLISASYILNDCEDFYYLTMAAITKYTWNHESNCKNDKDSLLQTTLRAWVPEMVHGVMHTAFNNRLESFIGTCAGTVFHALGGYNSLASEGPRCTIEADGGAEEINENCQGQAMRVVQYITSLCAFGLWPGVPGDPHGAPYRALAASIDIVRRIAITHMNDKTTKCDSGCDSCSIEWGKVIYDRVDDFQLDNSYGICLPCLKAAATDERHANLAHRCLKHTQYSNLSLRHTAMFSPE
ncbi:hypothetical protein LTR67_007886 [Exophiala xenobiotica]